MSGWTIGACALAAAAAALATPARGLLPPRRTVGRTPYVGGGVVLAVGVVLLAGEPRVIALAAIATGAGLSAGVLVARRRADRVAVTVRRRVVEMCDGLHAELTAGQTPSAALARAAEEWSVLSAVSRSASSGGDVSQALRALASTPGAGGLRVVAAAWQVAHRTGHGLADALSRVAQELRDAEHTRRLVDGELASARATARMVAALPVVALLVGTGAGADPWTFLLTDPVGLACLAGGVALGVAGLAWIEALARDVQREQ